MFQFNLYFQLSIFNFKKSNGMAVDSRKQSFGLNSTFHLSSFSEVRICPGKKIATSFISTKSFNLFLLSVKRGQTVKSFPRWGRAPEDPPAPAQAPPGFGPVCLIRY